MRTAPDCFALRDVSCFLHTTVTFPKWRNTHMHRVPWYPTPQECLLVHWEETGYPQKTTGLSSWGGSSKVQTMHTGRPHTNAMCVRQDPSPVYPSCREYRMSHHATKWGKDQVITRPHHCREAPISPISFWRMDSFPQWDAGDMKDWRDIYFFFTSLGVLDTQASVDTCWMNFPQFFPKVILILEWLFLVMECYSWIHF